MPMAASNWRNCLGTASNWRKTPSPHSLSKFQLTALVLCCVNNQALFPGFCSARARLRAAGLALLKAPLPPLYLRQNILGFGRPNPWLWLRIPLLDELDDGGDEARNAGKTSPPNRPACLFRQPAFDPVHPTGTGRNAMGLHARMPGQPTFAPRVLVGAVLVQHQGQFNLLRIPCIPSAGGTGETLEGAVVDNTLRPLFPGPLPTRRTAWWFRGAQGHASRSRPVRVCAANPVECDPRPGFGSFHQYRARRRSAVGAGKLPPRPKASARIPGPLRAGTSPADAV